MSGWTNCSAPTIQFDIILNQKKNQLSSHNTHTHTHTHQRILKCILRSTRSQPKSTISCVLPNIWYSGKGKCMEIVKRLVVAKNSGERENGWIDGGYF